MLTNPRVLKSLSIGLAALMCSQSAALAQPLPSAARPAAVGPALRFSLPSSVALIEDRFAVANGKTVVLIQDAHTNESGQMNVARALETILPAEGIQVLFTEGADSDVTPDEFRIGDAVVREKVGQAYLRKGLLNGGEYFSMTSDHIFRIVGVEDLSLYYKAGRLMRDASEGRRAAVRWLERLSRALHALKSDLWSEPLRQLDAERSRYAAGDLPLTEYFSRLVAAGRAHKVTTAAYPDLKKLLELRDRENGIDFKKAGEEEAQAIKTLSAADREQLQGLRGGYSPFRKTVPGNRSSQGFFAALEAALVGIDRDAAARYPALFEYFSYLSASATLDAAGALEELTAFESAVWDAMASDRSAKQLETLIQSAGRMRRIAELQATPDDYSAFQSLTAAHDPRVMAGWVNRRIAELGKHYDLAVALDPRFEAPFRSAVEFYRTNTQRDGVMVERILARMDAAGIDRAAVVTGGFHTPNLKKMLRARGVGYVSVLPQVTHETNMDRYDRLVREALYDIDRQTPAASVMRPDHWMTPAVKSAVRMADHAQILQTLEVENLAPERRAVQGAKGPDPAWIEAMERSRNLFARPLDPWELIAKQRRETFAPPIPPGPPSGAGDPPLYVLPPQAAASATITGATWTRVDDPGLGILSWTADTSAFRLREVAVRPLGGQADGDRNPLADEQTRLAWQSAQDAALAALPDAAGRDAVDVSDPTALRDLMRSSIDRPVRDWTARRVSGEPDTAVVVPGVIDVDAVGLLDVTGQIFINGTGAAGQTGPAQTLTASTAGTSAAQTIDFDGTADLNRTVDRLADGGSQAVQITGSFTAPAAAPQVPQNTLPAIAGSAVTIVTPVTRSSSLDELVRLSDAQAGQTAARAQTPQVPTTATNDLALKVHGVSYSATAAAGVGAFDLPSQALETIIRAQAQSAGLSVSPGSAEYEAYRRDFLNRVTIFAPTDAAAEASMTDQAILNDALALQSQPDRSGLRVVQTDNALLARVIALTGAPIDPRDGTDDRFFYASGSLSVADAVAASIIAAQQPQGRQTLALLSAAGAGGSADASGAALGTAAGDAVTTAATDALLRRFGIDAANGPSLFEPGQGTAGGRVAFTVIDDGSSDLLGAAGIGPGGRLDDIEGVRIEPAADGSGSLVIFDTLVFGPEGPVVVRTSFDAPGLGAEAQRPAVAAGLTASVSAPVTGTAGGAAVRVLGAEDAARVNGLLDTLSGGLGSAPEYARALLEVAGESLEEGDPAGAANALDALAIPANDPLNAARQELISTLRASASKLGSSEAIITEPVFTQHAPESFVRLFESFAAQVVLAEGSAAEGSVFTVLVENGEEIFGYTVRIYDISSGSFRYRIGDGDEEALVDLEDVKTADIRRRAYRAEEPGTESDPKLQARLKLWDNAILEGRRFMSAAGSFRAAYRLTPGLQYREGTIDPATGKIALDPVTGRPTGLTREQVRAKILIQLYAAETLAGGEDAPYSITFYMDPEALSDANANWLLREIRLRPSFTMLTRDNPFPAEGEGVIRFNLWADQPDWTPMVRTPEGRWIQTSPGVRIPTDGASNLRVRPETTVGTSTILPIALMGPIRAFLATVPEAADLSGDDSTERFMTAETFLDSVFVEKWLNRLFDHRARIEAPSVMLQKFKAVLHWYANQVAPFEQMTASEWVAFYQAIIRRVAVSV